MECQRYLAHISNCIFTSRLKVLLHDDVVSLVSPKALDLIRQLMCHQIFLDEPSHADPGADPIFLLVFFGEEDLKSLVRRQTFLEVRFHPRPFIGSFEL